jgi:hypothetical protein
MAKQHIDVNWDRRKLLVSLASLPLSRSLLSRTSAKAPQITQPNDIVGSWHYRSFINNPQHVDDLNSLLFGEGELTLDESPLGILAGAGDFADGNTVKFSGSVVHGTLISLRFQGAGTGAPNKDWLYDYFGVLVPMWPNGVVQLGQVPCIVGSVVRSAPHSNGSGGTAPAGRVASFVAVKK